MTTWTELYSAAVSLRRQWFASVTPNAATVSTVAVPVGAKCAIISAVGAGGWKLNSPYPGGGAAFARTKLTDLTSGEEFEVQVGSTKYSLDAGSSQGDSIVTRVTGALVVCKAARGTGTIVNGTYGGEQIVNGGTPGLIADCVGDTKRDGKYGNSRGGIYIGGFSGGDDSDIYSAGFGGRGAQHGRTPAAGWGGGGIHRFVYDGLGNIKDYPPGAGRVLIHWFTKDPEYPNV